VTNGAATGADSGTGEYFVPAGEESREDDRREDDLEGGGPDGTAAGGRPDQIARGRGRHRKDPVAAREPADGAAGKEDALEGHLAVQLLVDGLGQGEPPGVGQPGNVHRERGFRSLQPPVLLREFRQMDAGAHRDGLPLGRIAFGEPLKHRARASKRAAGRFEPGRGQVAFERLDAAARAFNLGPDDFLDPASGRFGLGAGLGDAVGQAGEINGQRRGEPAFVISDQGRHQGILPVHAYGREEDAGREARRFVQLGR